MPPSPPTSLSRLAKRRAYARKKSAGAVIFIVAMTLAVLASLGLYAMQAASTEVASSGFEVRKTQTMYLTQYGAMAAAQEVTGPKAQLFLSMMQDPSMRDTQCMSLAGVPTSASDASKSCRRMGAAELKSAGGWAVPVLETTRDTQNPGSLGIGQRRGDFVVELTDPAQTTPPAGYDLKLGLCFAQFTLSVTGITEADGTVTTEARYGSQGLMTGRGRITGGPVRCAQ